MKRASSIASAALALVASTTARAADDGAPFGDRAPNVVALDHLAGFVHVARVYPDLGGDAFTGNYLGLMAVPPIVRLGFHRVLAHRVTLGLGVHYADQSSPPGQPNGAPLRTWGLSPRLGVVVPFHPMLAVWLRAGLTYLNASQPGSTSLADPTQSTPDESEWHLALGAEAPLVFTPTAHVGIMLGPMIEWGVAGNLTVSGQRQQSEAIRWRMYGATIGLLVDF